MREVIQVDRERKGEGGRTVTGPQTTVKLVPILAPELAHCFWEHLARGSLSPVAERNGGPTILWTFLALATHRILPFCRSKILDFGCLKREITPFQHPCRVRVGSQGWRVPFSCNSLIAVRVREEVLWYNPVLLPPKVQALHDRGSKGVELTSVSGQAPFRRLVLSVRVLGLCCNHKA